eukprot:7670446-Pyramimonas_sp.AAC.1
MMGDVLWVESMVMRHKKVYETFKVGAFFLRSNDYSIGQTALMQVKVLYQRFFLDLGVQEYDHQLPVVSQFNILSMKDACALLSKIKTYMEAFTTRVIYTSSLRSHPTGIRHELLGLIATRVNRNRLCTDYSSILLTEDVWAYPTS